MKIDSPVQKFFEQYPCKKPIVQEFIQIMVQGNRYCDIADTVGYKESYVQTQINRYMLSHNLTRLTLMAKIYQIARDMDGLEESDEETAYQYLLRPDSVD